MNIKALAKTAYLQVKKPRLFMAICLAAMLLAMVFPSDLPSYREVPPSQHPLVQGVENYGRFINTAAQIALPFLKRDPIGIIQNIYIGIAGTLITHGFKRSLDHVSIGGVQLGERPNGGRHNMPSGHTSLASCAVYFVGRRYGWWHLLYLLPVMFLTMFTRVELNAHTWSAVIAGAMAGFLAAALFTGKADASGNKKTEQ